MSHPPNAPGPQGPEYNQQPGHYPPPGYGQQPPQKKSKKKWVIGCLGLIVLAMLLFAGCAAVLSGGAEDPATEPVADTPAEEPAEDPAAEELQEEPESPAVATDAAESAGTVTLEATASGSGTVMWGDMDGSTNTENFTGTWSKEIPLEDGSEMYTLMVSGDIMDDTSEVSCKLYVDGELKDEATGTGAAGSASCSQPIFG